MKFINKIDVNAKYILSTIEDAGYQAYLVGGCVRDMIMGVEPHDWDICTSAKPDEVKKIFKNLKVLDTGIKHGTVTVVIGDEFYEVTTFRCDGEYIDHRKPKKVSFTDNIFLDLERRDFTINAMAYSLDEGLKNPFGGYEDIKSGIIRCVGNPDDRFNEDALRILRALRFSARLGFEIDVKTASAIKKNKNLLLSISSERVNSELVKILSSRNCGNRVLREYSDVIYTIIPELKKMEGFSQNNLNHVFDVWEHTLHCMDYEVMDIESDIIVRLAVLLHDIGKPETYIKDYDGIGHFYGHAKVSAEMASGVLNRLRFSNDIREKVIELIKYHDTQIIPDRVFIKRMLNKLGYEQFERLLKLKEFDIYGQNRDIVSWAEKKSRLVEVYPILSSIREEDECFKVTDLNIDGHDLIALGIPQGKDIGVLLKELLSKVISGSIENDKEILLLEVEKIIKSN